MPTNKRESLIYSVMMCFCMVLWMSVYNVALHEGGLSWNVLGKAWLGMPITYVVAFILDWFIASKIAKGVAFRYIVSYESPGWKKIIAISTGMVIVMVVLMSLYGTIEMCFHTGEWGGIFFGWLSRIPMNFIMALPLQLIICGPLVRKVFRSLFPVGCVQ